MSSFRRVMLTALIGTAAALPAAGGIFNQVRQLTDCRNKSDEDCTFNATLSVLEIDTGPVGPKGGRCLDDPAGCQPFAKIRQSLGVDSLPKGEDWRFIVTPVGKPVLLKAFSVKVFSKESLVLESRLVNSRGKEMYQPVNGTDRPGSGYVFAFDPEAARRFEKHLKEGNTLGITADVEGGKGGRVIFSIATAKPEMSTKSRGKAKAKL